MKDLITLLFVSIFCWILFSPQEVKAGGKDLIYELKSIQQVSQKDLRNTVILFSKVSFSLAKKWDESLLLEVGRVVNLVMNIEENYQWTADPFSSIITGKRRGEFIKKVSKVLDSKKKKEIFEANIYLAMRVLQEGNG